jgi:hypothetical protein
MMLSRRLATGIIAVRHVILIIASCIVRAVPFVYVLNGSFVHLRFSFTRLQARA